MGDFLHKNAQTPFTQDFLAAGALCRFTTNFLPILEAARQTFTPLPGASPHADFSMRFWVDSNLRGATRWERPHLRGVDHLVFAGFDAGNFACADLRLHKVVGRFTPDVATDAAYLNRVVFPMLMSVIAASVGIAELHCACVVKDGRGLLLSGPPRSGKSTLSLALASLGFSFLSDDRTFCSVRENRLMAWSPLAEFKLRAEAMGWFSALSEIGRDTLENGDSGLRAQPEALQLNRSRECAPHGLVFLEPQIGSGFRLIDISPEEAQERLQHDLMAEPAGSDQERQRVVAGIAALPGAILRYSDTPQDVARDLAAHFEKLNRQNRGWSTDRAAKQIDTAARPADSSGFLSVVGSKRSDPLGRFTSRLHSATVTMMGRSIRFDTNSSKLLEQVQTLFASYPPACHATPQFHWTVISQPEVTGVPGYFQRVAFSDPGLRFVQFDDRCYFAVDLTCRRAIGFVTDQMVDDGSNLALPFLDTLFCATAASLGLVPLHSCCVGKDGKGLLILGESGSGKTSTGYLALKSGMRMHADEGVFLEANHSGLRAWGGFWPIMFRCDALDFYPELQKNVRRYKYQDFSYYNVDQGILQPAESPSVAPVGCVFLKRTEGSEVQIAEVNPDMLRWQLANSLLVEEEDQFLPNQDSVLSALAGLPAYQITYGPDPAAAIPVVTDLFLQHAA